MPVADLRDATGMARGFTLPGIPRIMSQRSVDMMSRVDFRIYGFFFGEKLKLSGVQLLSAGICASRGSSLSQQ